jgi:hypothetical protein
MQINSKHMCVAIEHVHARVPASTISPVNALLLQCQVLYDSSRLGAKNLLEMSAYMLVLNSRFLRYRDKLKDVLM